METKTIPFTYDEYDSPEELQPHDRDLLSRAKEAHKNAYAPYSQYHVGAAILLENGKILTGNNQENSARYNHPAVKGQYHVFFSQSAPFVIKLAQYQKTDSTQHDQGNYCK